MRALVLLATMALLAGCTAPSQPATEPLAGQPAATPPGSDAAPSPAAAPAAPPAANANATDRGEDAWTGEVLLSVSVPGETVGITGGGHTLPTIPWASDFVVNVSMQGQLAVGSIHAWLVKDEALVAEAEGPSPLTLAARLEEGQYELRVGGGGGSVHAGATYEAQATWTRAA